MLLILWVNGCREDQRKDTYKDYVKNVQAYATGSQRLGRRFNRLLTTRGTSEAEVENLLSGLAQQQEQIVGQARGLDSPGRLRDEHEHLLDALDLRASGLRGMTEAFKSTSGSQTANQVGRRSRSR